MCARRFLAGSLRSKDPFANPFALGQGDAVFVYGKAGSINDARAHLSAREGVVFELWGVQDPQLDGFGQSSRIGPGVFALGRQVVDGEQDGHGLGDEFLFAGLDFRRGQHIGSAQGVVDGAPHDLAGCDNILGGGGVMGFGMADDVVNVRLERHLHVGAGGQVSPRGLRVERV